MSVNLAIRWADGRRELHHLGSFRRFKDGWGPTAAGIGLELIPQFFSWYPVTPENIDQMIHELAALRAEFVRLGFEGEEDTGKMEWLAATLDELRLGTGWTASIG